MGDLTKGSTFTNGQQLLATDLNDLVDNAVIKSSVVTAGHLSNHATENIINGQGILALADISNADYILVWSATHGAFRRVLKSDFLASVSASLEVGGTPLVDPATNIIQVPLVIQGTGVTSSGDLWLSQNKGLLFSLGNGTATACPLFMSDTDDVVKFFHSSDAASSLNIFTDFNIQGTTNFPDAGIGLSGLDPTTGQRNWLITSESTPNPGGGSDLNMFTYGPNADLANDRIQLFGKLRVANGIEDTIGNNLLPLTTATATALGDTALAALTSGSYNVAIGTDALGLLTGGNSNTAVGQSAMEATNGSENTSVGMESLKATTSGGTNVAVGCQALKNNVSGNGSVAVGANALKNNTAHYNTAVGFSAGLFNSSGSQNTAVGASALKENSSATSNTAVGYHSLEYNTGGGNTAVGADSLTANTTGTANTALGTEALATNTTNTSNTAVGYNSLKTATASGNTAVGSYSLKAVTTGGTNTAVGLSAGKLVEDGYDNCMVGERSASALTSGASNVCVGNSAGAALVSGDNNVVIGSTANVSGAGADSQIVLGRGITATADMEFSFGAVSNVASCDFGSSAAFSYASDERKKQDIKEDPLGLDFVNALRPVTYRWKPIAEWPSEWAESKGDEPNTESVMHGMIAQDVKAALDTAGVDTFAGWNERPDGQQTLALESFIMPLIKAVQELTAKVEKLEAK